MENKTGIYAFEVRTLTGKTIKLSEYAGKTLLIVNTASKCGFTPQYEGLQKLYKDYKDSGFEILGFPCNQFGGQEPGNAKEIESFCESNFNITFPIFEKIKVNGPDAEPLFKYLKKNAKGFLGFQRIQWNFTKFLVSPEGKIIKRFTPATTPESIKPFIKPFVER